MLKKYFRKFNTAIVALSGGADSSAVLKLVVDYLGKENVLAATCVNFNMFLYEINFAYKVADSFAVPWKPFYSRFARELLTDNEEKCFYCKKSILSELVKIKEKNGIDVIFDGSNVDDLTEYRPGMKALEMFHVKSPLLDNGLGKEDVYKIIKSSKLSTFSFHSESCISTRIRTDDATYEDLRKIEIAEDKLREKFPLIRLRFFGNYIKVEFKSNLVVSENAKSFIIQVLKNDCENISKIIF